MNDFLNKLNPTCDQLLKLNPTQTPGTPGTPATPTNDKSASSALMALLGQTLVDVLYMGEVAHIAGNLLLTRRPMIEKQLDSITYRDIRQKHFVVVAENIAEAVFCDKVEHEVDRKALTLAQQMLVIFLTGSKASTIERIKQVRDVSGLSLRNAKDLILKIEEQDFLPSLVDLFGQTEKLEKDLAYNKGLLEDLRRALVDERSEGTRLRNLLNEERETRVRRDRICDARYDQVLGLEALLDFAKERLDVSLKPVIEGGLRGLSDQYDQALGR